MFQSILRGVLAAAGFAIVVPAMTMPASAAEYAVTTRMNVQYVEHDGVKLTGNLYAPKGRDKAPVIVAVHGGGWQVGRPPTYQHWGPLLAKNGYAVFAIRYRLMKPGVKTYPGAVYDVKAAIQYVRANAAELGVDPARIGLMGDSAGAHLAALGGACRRRAAVLQRVPQRSARGDARERESHGRVLRRLRHAGAMAARSACAPERPDRGEVSRRLADAKPPRLFRQFADELCDDRQARQSSAPASS